MLINRMNTVIFVPVGFRDSVLEFLEEIRSGIRGEKGELGGVGVKAAGKADRGTYGLSRLLW